MKKKKTEEKNAWTTDQVINEMKEHSHNYSESVAISD